MRQSTLRADLHVHSKLPAEYYQRVLDVAEQAEPDLAVFTGDFITALDSLSKLREVLRPVGKRGDFAVLGNHEYWADAGAVGAVVKEKGKWVVKAAGPTTSAREEPYQGKVIESYGVRGVIGKVAIHMQTPEQRKQFLR